MCVSKQLRITCSDLSKLRLSKYCHKKNIILMASQKESGKEKGGDNDESSSLVELGLGLGFGSSSESSACENQVVKSGGDEELGLGLGLGLGSENYYGSFCLRDGDGFKYDFHNHNHNNNNNNNNIGNAQHDYRQDMPSSSLWSLPHDYLLRPHHPPGLWFTLRSSLNREGEVLPQIPKAYIRVKDENMTVFMVKTYLITKLGLSNQDQVEISCMGQKLVHSQSLKHVRDAIWFPRLAQVFNSNPTLFQHNNSIGQQTTLTYLLPLDYGPTGQFHSHYNSYDKIN